MNTKSTQNNEQSSAVVYKDTIFGLKATRIVGNRTRDPLADFENSWTRILSLPASPLQLALDGSVWLFSASFVLKLAQLTAFGMFLLLPLGAFLLALITAYAYIPSIRFVIAVRLALITLGIIFVI